MSNSPRPDKGDRRAEAKATADALRAKQAKDAARQRTIAIAALVVGLAVVGGLVAVILNQGSRSSAATTDQLNPAAASAHGGFVFDKAGLLTPPANQVDPGADGTAGTGDDIVWPQGLAASGGPVVVSVYFDFMCPWCGYFEQTQAPKLDVLRAAGAVVIDSHPISILDRYSSGTNYSTRAAAAAIAVAQGDPSHYFTFVEALMAKDTQPAENSEGLSDAKMAEIAKGIGVPQDVIDQITSGAYTDYAATATELASKDLGSLQTPTILLNGKQLHRRLDPGRRARDGYPGGRQGLTRTPWRPPGTWSRSRAVAHAAGGHGRGRGLGGTLSTAASGPGPAVTPCRARRLSSVVEHPPCKRTVVGSNPTGGS